MISHSTTSGTNLFATVATLWGCALSHCCAAVVLTLPQEIVVHSRDVRAADLFADAPGDRRQNEALAKMDLVTIAPEETEVQVRKSYLRIRLILSGWKDTQFRINGPESTTVKYLEAVPITDSDIEAAAVKTMASVLGTSVDDLRVRLTRPFMESLPTGMRSRQGMRVEVASPARAEPGSVSLTVRLWDGRNLAITRAGRFDVLKKYRVAVTRVSLQRDTTIDRNDVQFENRYLPTTADEPQETDIYGQRARTNLRAGQLLTLRDVERPTPKSSEVVIKTREKVEVTAISGLLRIRMRQAEAMQTGRVGDIISLRNLESREIITGRVTGPGTVEIRLR